MLNDKIEPIISNGVAYIGEKYIIPKGIGIFSWSWTYDEGKLHTMFLIIYSTFQNHQ